MTTKTLEDVIRDAKSVSAHLYNQQVGANVYPGVPPE